MYIHNINPLFLGFCINICSTYYTIFFFSWEWRCGEFDATMFKFIIDNVKGCLIVALVWSDTLMRRAFFVLQPYLTNVWKLDFTHAAAIVNIWEGTSLMLPAVFQFLADKYLGNFKVVVICSVASTLGLGFITMSFPPVLDINSCKEYKPECIEGQRRALLYLGVALTAIGRGGLTVCVPALHDEQSEAGQFSLCGFLQRQGSTAPNLCVYALGTLIISLITSWSFRFGFPAIFAAFVTLSFLGGWSIYRKSGPKCKGSLLATVFKVFTVPRSTTHNSRINLAQHQVTPEESSFVRHITAVSITFIILGIVSALANTFFVEQANHMNRKIGFLTVPLAAFQLPMLIGIIAGPCLCTMFEFMRCVNNFGRYCIPQCLRVIPSILGIGAAMVHAILCCMVAAAVEKRRLHVMRSSHMKDDDIVPMHATWLIFQFYLVACVDVFFRSSADAYYHAQAPGELRGYYDVYTDFVSGLGFFSSVVLVVVVGKASESGGKPSWFEKSVNTSRLDRYYWVLTVLSCLSLGAFLGMASFCICRDAKAADVDGETERERRGDGGGDQQSSCCFLR